VLSALSLVPDHAALCAAISAPIIVKYVTNLQLLGLL
jgi:hypothetical protein